MYKPRKKHLVYPLIAIILVSSGVYIERVRSNGQNPTWDELLGMFNVPWFNASTGVNAPAYYQDGIPVVETASYVIFKEGTTTYARNGSTGKIDYSGSVASTVIQSALDALTTDRTWKEKVFIKGDYLISAVISIPSYTIVESNAYFERTYGGSIFQVLGTSPSWISNVEIIGGIYNGSKQVFPSSQDPVILIDYVEHIKISDVYISDCSWWGVCSKQPVSVRWSELTDSYVENSDGVINMNMDEYFVWSNNHAKNNDIDFRTSGSQYGTIEGNVIQGGIGGGITVQGGSSKIDVIGNTIIEKDKEGIEFAQSYESIAIGNLLVRNGRGGFKNWQMNNCTIEGNILIDNFRNNIDQAESPIAAQISTFSLAPEHVSKYNVIKDNQIICNGGGSPDPAYGIGEYVNQTGVDGEIDYNTYQGNTFVGSHGTGYASFYGENNIYQSLAIPFAEGHILTSSGWEIDANGEQAFAWTSLPSDVQQVISIKIYARGRITETHGMTLEFISRGASDNENFQTHTASLVNETSTSQNFSIDDVIYWTITHSGITSLLAGDSIEIIILHEAADGDDCATNAIFRSVIFEYI